MALGLSGSAWAGQDNTNQAPKELRLELNLIDGSRTIGVPTIESVPIQTSYPKMDVPLKQVLAHQFRLAPRNGVHRPVQRRQAQGRRQPCAHQAADNLRGHGDQHRARQGFSHPVDPTPSLPDARPHSDRFLCGGRESNFLQLAFWRPFTRMPWQSRRTKPNHRSNLR